MTDVLDELADANPVDRDRVAVSSEMRARALSQPFRDGQPTRPRRHGWVLTGGFAAASLAAAVVLFTGGEDDGGLPGLADRAYAATAGPGVIHWRTDITQSNSRALARAEGWSAGGVTHVVLSQGRTPDTLRPELELRTANGREQALSPSDNSITERQAPRGPAVDVSQPFDDPLLAFRAAYRRHRLKQIDPQTFQVRLPANTRKQTGVGTLTYVLDPRTARPLRLVVRSEPAPAHANALARKAARNVVTYTFSVYERLPNTSLNRQRLALPAGAGKGPPAIDARQHFAALRSGRVLTESQRTVARSLAAAFASRSRRTHLRRAMFPAQARRIGTLGALMPGDDSLCLFVKGGGTCSTTKQALRSGIALSGSNIRGMLVVVPDGVTALQGRLPRHSWRTFHVENNTATLPNGGYHFRLVR